MFEQIFRNVLAGQKANRPIIDKFWEEISSCYNSPGRHYHTTSHLDHIAVELTAVQNNIVDWSTIVFSIAYHDIIYDPLKQDNEEKSASLAFERLTELGIPTEQKDQCERQILATKSHQPADPDTDYFTDADLSILGAPRELYLSYTKQIRDEYKVYPDLIYNAGRSKVLQHFLGMTTIFKTSGFREKYELKASENLLFELDILT